MKSDIIITLHSVVVSAIMSLLSLIAAGQGNEIITERIAVHARPSMDSITLRWAPMNATLWHWANQYGYRVERYTLARDGSLLSQPEKAILATFLKPVPEAQWENLIQRDKFAGIAAQALYGERFEINLNEAGIITMVNKVRENEQRFLFALLSADMSAPVAKRSGLMLTDNEVRPGEKYLYRIVVHSMDSLRGSVFVGCDDHYDLPKPLNLKADFKERLVSLRWDKADSRYYTAYSIERSADGKNFRSVSDLPSLTASPNETEDTRYEYAMDSLPDFSGVYYYRVRGLTCFGEMGPPSAVASGRGSPSVHAVPYIRGATSKENQTILIRWDFPDSDNDAIKGFAVERSLQHRGDFEHLTEKLLPADARLFEDQHPSHANYYRVTAQGLDGARYPSPVYFMPLVDSVPPSAPVGLEATVDDAGGVLLSWKSNEEADLYGYRIYKAYYRSEELAQITEGPVSDTTFRDQVDLNTLNETAYYRVMALDINQNHSQLSELLRVALPDKVAPQPPVLLSVTDSAGGLAISWAAGGSADIVAYAIYRNSPGKESWNLIHKKSALNDSLNHFLDKSALAAQVYHYTILSIDDAGLESIPAHPVTGIRRERKHHPPVAWRKPRINRELNQITVAWEYHQYHVQAFRIYRAVNDYPPVLFQTLDGKENQFTHRLVPGQRYSYRIMAVFSDGNKSTLSEEIQYQY